MRTVLNARYWTDGGKGPLHFAVDFNELRLIGLDTTVEGTAAGQVAEHLPWLRDALSAKGPAASLLFLHHHVFECGIEPMGIASCAEDRRRWARYCAIIRVDRLRWRQAMRIAPRQGRWRAYPPTSLARFGPPTRCGWGRRQSPPWPIPQR